MVGLVATLQLVGYALGAVGGALVFVEFFQLPSYVSFDTDLKRWDVDLAPDDVREHTWLGRVGGLCIALGFTLLFVAQLL